MIFDAHTDVLSDIAVRRQRGEQDVFRRCHLERFIRGGIGGGIFAIWVERRCQTDPAERTRQIVSCMEAECAQSDALRLVSSAGELEGQGEPGTVRALPGAEGLAALGGDPGRLEWYYRHGVRVASLTWNEANGLAAGARSGESGGLTAAGRETVRRLRQLGMLLDVSHLNDAGFRDVVRMGEGPFAATHSNCRALCGADRNLTDPQLRAIRDAGGVVGLNAYHGFIDGEPARQTAERLAQHAAHMIDVMGIDHVGCGFDFCEFLEGEAGEPAAAGLEDCSQAPGLFDCLRRMGLSEAERQKIADGNFLRLLRQTVG